MDIQKAGELKAFIENLIETKENTYTGALEEYLRSMLNLLYSYKDEPASFSVFGELIEKAFTSAPAVFQLSWIKYDKLPYSNYEPNPDDFENSLIGPDGENVVTKFEVLEKTLMFQIALLRNMEENTASDENIDMEYDEDTLWTNFDPFSYLKASLNGLPYDNEEECDWLTFADMLEYGRTMGILD